MGLQLPGHVQEAMGAMGAKFPGTDEDSFETAATSWEDLASVCSDAADQLGGTVDSVGDAGADDGVAAMHDYMAGNSNISGLRALSEAATQIAANHRSAGAAIKGQKTAIIGVASMVQAMINIAKLNPAISQAAVSAVIARCGQQLATTDQQVASYLSGGQ